MHLYSHESRRALYWTLLALAVVFGLATAFGVWLAPAALLLTRDPAVMRHGAPCRHDLAAPARADGARPCADLGLRQAPGANCIHSHVGCRLTPE